MSAVDVQPSLLDLIAGDPIHADDRGRVEAAIRADALAHNGIADPNRVRRSLTDGNGDLIVHPRVLSATYSALCRMGALTQAGWTENDQLSSRNRGRPQRLWALTT